MNRKKRRAAAKSPPDTQLLATAARLHQAGQLVEAEACYRRVLAAQPNLAETHFNLGNTLLQQGKLDEAIAAYRRAIVIEPDYAEAYCTLGMALVGQGKLDDAVETCRRAIGIDPDLTEAYCTLGAALARQGKLDEAVAECRRAIVIGPDYAEAYCTLGGALAWQGRLDEAVAECRRAIVIKPDYAEAYCTLGGALARQGKLDEAIAAFQGAIGIKPDYAEAFDDLGKAYLSVGMPQLAIQAAGRALELEETEQRKMVFAYSAQAYSAQSVTFSAEDARLRKLLLRALSEGWARPRNLAHVCVSLVTLSAVIKEAIARVQAAWPQRLGGGELLGAAGLAELARDELLRRLLETNPVTDLGLERLLANLRHAMLTSAYAVFSDEEDTSRIGGQQTGRQRAALAPREENDPLLAFYCSIARQCFVNEFVFSKTEDEEKRAQELRMALEVALAAEQPVPALWLAVVGAYFPLHALANASALLARSWPTCIDALVVQQISEPAEERQIAAEIPALTAIEGEVSRLVRQQYEENPYPRWITAGPAGQLHKYGPEQTPDVLIAGCGTGLSATEWARYARGARILAIDLSLASLSYAKRMAQKFRLTNIEFAQADIMKLGTLGRQFDFIDASGVLHHLADPWEGWRILLSLLRPGGDMVVGLYSAQARRNVVAGRALIAQRGFRPTPDDIRRCREEIAAAEDGSLLKSLTHWADFFTIGECRDMLFHPQEHRLTLPEIKDFLAATDLQFMGFDLPPPELRRFALRFPGEAALTDLARWHAFECEAPETFCRMYLFTVRKPPPQ